MANLPERIEEVKSILVAWNLKTNTGFKYIKGRDRVTWLLLETREFDFEKGLLEETDMVLAWPPDDEPGAAGYEGDPTLYYERASIQGEINEGHLAMMQLQAKAVANPRTPIIEGDGGPAAISSSVVNIDVGQRKGKAVTRPPRDVMVLAGKVLQGHDWKKTMFVMYENSWFGKLNEAGGYAGKCNRKMRVYTRGNKEIEIRTGLSRQTISRHLMNFKKHKIILQHKRGYCGQKCSIWELPYSVRQVLAWKRQRA